MPPKPVEVADTVRIYDPAWDKWYTGWWNIFTQKGDNLYAAINIATAATHKIIPGVSGKRIIITTIFFTVGGGVNITLKDGDTAITGPMDFGGTNEPRGMVVNLGNHGLELSDGNDFNITLSAAVQVSGVVVYRLV